MYSSYGYHGGLETASVIVVCILALLYVSLIGARYVAVSTLFMKAGEAPWKSIIPAYDVYTFFKITWNTKMFIPYICTLAGYIVGAIGYIVAVTNFAYFYYSGLGITAFFIILMFVCGIAFIVFHVMLCNHISKSYGQGTGFTVGLVLLSLIFFMILAFGESKYIGIVPKRKSIPNPEYYYQQQPQQPAPPVQPTPEQAPVQQQGAEPVQTPSQEPVSEQAPAPQASTNTQPPELK